LLREAVGNGPAERSLFDDHRAGQNDVARPHATEDYFRQASSSASPVTHQNADA
jgi:hypothetical protein